MQMWQNTGQDQSEYQLSIQSAPISYVVIIANMQADTIIAQNKEQGKFQLLLSDWTHTIQILHPTLHHS